MDGTAYFAIAVSQCVKCLMKWIAGDILIKLFSSTSPTLLQIELECLSLAGLSSKVLICR